MLLGTFHSIEMFCYAVMLVALHNIIYYSVFLKFKITDWSYTLKSYICYNNNNNISISKFHNSSFYQLCLYILHCIINGISITYFHKASKDDSEVAYS